MVRVAGRLLLLLLLVADWAGDPYFGHSLLSQPLSSQPAFCHSLPLRTTLLRATTQSGRDLLLCAVPSSWTALCPYLPTQPWEVWQPLFPATDLLYALMSLQC